MGNNATGIALKTLREKARLSIRAAASEAGVSMSYLSRAETGEVTPTPAWVHNMVTSIGKHIQEKGAA